MATSAWTQADLARKLQISSSTVSRALAKRVASGAFISRAELLLDGDRRGPASANSVTAQELHLLQEMYRLLKTVSGRIEELAAESRERERKEGIGD